ncbi:MAG: sulfatase [Planctomycetota bacterium]
MSLKIPVVVLALFTCFSNWVSTAVAEQPPNIVVIFTDDQGYGDVGSYGAEGFETPHLDELAAEGMRFTDWYVAQAVCSASRAALLTGCYPNRIGILGALGPRSKHGINAKETTLAEVCKSKGYATAIFGKWHLGHLTPFLPLQHGFDEYYGLPYSNYMWPLHPNYAHLPDPAVRRKRGFPDLPMYEGNEIVNKEVSGEDQARLTTEYTERAVDFIDRNAEKPFFLYVPHSMPHVPLFVSEKFKGKSQQGMYGDVIMEIDWSVGQIVAALEKHKLRDRTLVIFTSDNGPWISYGDHAGTTGGLREAKGTMFDGGCRTPCIMSWPGTIPEGSTCRELAATIDILPTVCELIDAELPSLPIDGKSIVPLMKGDASAKTPHEAYYFYYGRQLQAIRSGPWKMHFQHGYRTLNGRKGGTGGDPVKYDQAKIQPSLFNLDADVAESKDVKDEHPEIVALLSNMADGMRTRLGDNKRKGSETRPAGQMAK